MTRAALLLTLAACVQAPAAPGPHAIGYAVDAFTSDAGPLTLHLWYPADQCTTPMTFGHYVAGDESHFDGIRQVAMTACRDAAPLAGTHPVLIGRHEPGVWPVQAEHFAGHGYIVAMVASRGSRITATGDERLRAIGANYERQAREMQYALAHVTAARQGDVTRVGVLASGAAPLLFAMQTPDVRAVSLQDAGVFGDGLTSMAVRTSSWWAPDRLRAPLTYFLTRAEAERETRQADFDAIPATPRLRQVLDVSGAPSHDDLSSARLLRSRTSDAPDNARDRAFHQVLDAQRRFFDAWLRSNTDALPRLPRPPVPDQRQHRLASS